MSLVPTIFPIAENAIRWEYHTGNGDLYLDCTPPVEHEHSLSFYAGSVIEHETTLGDIRQWGFLLWEDIQEYIKIIQPDLINGPHHKIQSRMDAEKEARRIFEAFMMDKTRKFRGVDWWNLTCPRLLKD